MWGFFISSYEAVFDSSWVKLLLLFSKDCIFVIGKKTGQKRLRVKTADVLAELQGKFEEYLEQHELQKTKTRFKILENLLGFEREFDVEDVNQKMEASNYHVSKVTIYTTLDILTKAGILFRMARTSGAVYVLSHHCEGKALLFCAECGRINYTKDKLCRQVQKFSPKRYRKIQSFLVTMGMCTECCRKEKAIERKRVTKK